MGNYNSQYENYYKTFINRSGENIRRYNAHNKLTNKKSKKNFIVKRIVQDLAGVFFMLAFVIVCKFIVTPQTTAAYSYCKDVVNKDFNYKIVISNIKKIDKNKSVQDTVLDLIDKAKVKFTGGQTIKEKIKQKFSLPTSGSIKDSKDGLYLEVKDKGQIAASYDGRIKECGYNDKFGKYVLIDHGFGIESEYYSLNNVLVKKGDRVKKGDIIAENHSQDIQNYVGFKILFMGQSKGLEKILGNKS